MKKDGTTIYQREFRGEKVEIAVRLLGPGRFEATRSGLVVCVVGRTVGRAIRRCLRADRHAFQFHWGSPECVPFRPGRIGYSPRAIPLHPDTIREIRQVLPSGFRDLFGKDSVDLASGKRSVAHLWAMQISNRTIKAAVEQLYRDRTERSTYAEFQSAADVALLGLLRGAGEQSVFLGMFTETPLWLAAHRLKARGQVVEVLSNCFRLTERLAA